MLTLSARTEATTARAADIVQSEQAAMSDRLAGALVHAESEQDCIRS